MSEELKPCPFCGGEAELRDDGETDYPFIVQCVECGGMTCGHRHADTPFGAIAAWNARADYQGYEQAAIEAWESIKAWNTRAERTCQRFWTGAEMICSSCAHQLNNGTARYCPNCGSRVIG